MFNKNYTIWQKIKYVGMCFFLLSIFLTYDALTCFAGVITPNFPDAIICTDATNNQQVFILSISPYFAGTYIYLPADQRDNTSQYLDYNADGTWNSGVVIGYTTCTSSQSIATLTSLGVVRNFGNTVSTTTSTTTIQTIDNPNEDYFFGVFLFLFCLGGIMFSFKRKEN